MSGRAERLHVIDAQLPRCEGRRGLGHPLEPPRGPHFAMGAPTIDVRLVRNPSATRSSEIQRPLAGAVEYPQRALPFGVHTTTFLCEFAYAICELRAGERAEIDQSLFVDRRSQIPHECSRIRTLRTYGRIVRGSTLFVKSKIAASHGGEDSLREYSPVGQPHFDRSEVRPAPRFVQRDCGDRNWFREQRVVVVVR